MKQVVLTAFCIAIGAGAAFAQDGADKRVEELKREFERSLKGLQEKFDQERARIEKEFKAARERLLEKRGDGEEKKKPQGVEGMLAEILKRVESLEKRLEKEAPRLRELPRMVPKDFDFKRFGEAPSMPEEWRQWLEKMPRFKGGEDFKFEFRKDAPPKKEKKEKEQD